MVVYVADNYTTGERIMSYDHDAFRQAIKETFDSRIDEEIQAFRFDMEDPNVLADLHDSANEGKHLAMVVLNYWKENGGK